MAGLVFVVLLAVMVPIVVSGGNIVRFSHNDIQDILTAHNQLRRSVHNAANMREMTWNEGVALAAAEWGSRCEYISRPDNNWGQNMNYFYGDDYHRSATHLFSKSFNSWSNETSSYDNKRYRYCGRNHDCSYLQLIAADVQEIGCAIVKCPKLEFQIPSGVQRHTKLLICFYTPWVNILNEQVYIAEKRCSACPPGTTCVDNLCSAKPFQDAETRRLSLQGGSGVNIDTVSGGPEPSEDKGASSQIQDDRVIGRDNTFKSVGVAQPGSNSVALPEPGSPFAPGTVSSGGDRIVVYTPNNRVIPFPDIEARRTIRRIERYEAKNEHDLDVKQEKIIHTLELAAKDIEVTNVTGNGNSRKKRALSYQQLVYQRKLEYQRYLQEYNRIMHERERRRREYEEQLYRREQELRRQEQHQKYLEAEELRRRNHNNLMAQELRQAGSSRDRYTSRDQYYAELRRRDEEARYYEELRRRERRLQMERRRYEAMALTQNTGELTGEEQFFTISAHNLIRREAGAKDLAWSSNLERWAKYVIRCETEYPGPITCHTNFGKAEPGEEIYNVVYGWGNEEENDMQRPLRYGCRTPYDKALCNHKSNIQEESLRQMACASKSCGLQRQMTCIYSTG